MSPHTFELPITAVSEANRRDHWATKARRVKLHRNTAYALCPAFPLPCVVTLTRVAPRMIDQHDNLPASLKACVDGIAQRLGVDDRSPLVVWRYGQKKGAPCVLVSLEAMDSGERGA